MTRRALFVSHSYYLRDTRLRRHAEALAEDGWSVEVLCARDTAEPARSRVGGVRVTRLPSRRLRGSKARYVWEYLSFTVLAFGAVLSRATQRRYDLCYVLSLPNLLVVAGLPARAAGAHLVLDVRDPMPEFFTSKYPDSPFARALRLEERLACRIASAVVTVSPVMADLLTRTGVPREAIHVVLNVPDPRIFGEAMPGTVRPAADRTVLYAGTVATRYGVDLIPKAVARLKGEIEGLRAVIVGDGDAVELVRGIAEQEGVADRVELAGPRRLEEMPAFVRNAWVGAQPHREDALMRYCLSTKVLEWCALGLPAIVSRTPAMESVLTGEEVVYVAPGSLDELCAALRAAHADAEALSARAMRARAATERFAWRHEVEALRALAEGRRPEAR